MKHIQIAPTRTFEYHEELPTIKVTKNMVFVSIIVFFSGFTHGVDTYVLNILMTTNFKKELRINFRWHQILSAVLPTGAFLACIFAAPLNDNFGRRCVIILSCVVLVIGDAITTVADHYYTFVAGRLVSGFAIGLSSITVPIYISECAPPYYRGQFLVLYQLSISSGKLLAIGISVGLGTDSYYSRSFFIINIVFSVLQFFGMMLVPESPRWLALNFKLEKARSAFVWLQGSDEGVEETINIIEEEADEFISPHDEDSFTIHHIVRQAAVRRALVVGCIIEIVRQATGFEGISNFITTLYYMAGETAAATLQLFFVLLGIEWLMNFLTVFSVDRFGRRQLTILSLMGCVGGLIIFGLIFRKLSTSLTVKMKVRTPYDYTGLTCKSAHVCIDCVFQDHCGFCYHTEMTTFGLLESVGACLPTRPFAPNASFYGPCDKGSQGRFRWGSKQCPSNNEDLILSNLSLVILFMSFAHGIGPLSQTINAEIYPSWARSTSMAVSGAVRWSSSAILLLVFYGAQHLMGHHIGFFVFAALTLCGLLLFMVILPETKRKKLEDIPQLFERRWDFYCCKI